MFNRFREELKELSQTIKKRNEKLVEFKYGWLDPEFVPNSISIWAAAVFVNEDHVKVIKEC